MSTNLTKQVLLEPVLGVEAVMLTDDRDLFSPMLSGLLSIVMRFTLMMPTKQNYEFLALRIFASYGQNLPRHYLKQILTVSKNNIPTQLIQTFLTSSN